MPSPIAHSVSGYAIARLFSPDRIRSHSKRLNLVWLACATFLAVAPDLDFILQIATGKKYHHGFSHSLAFMAGVTVIVGGLSYVWLNRVSIPLLLLTLLCYGFHLLLDFFTAGGPGMQLFWPFSTDYVRSSISIFPSTEHSEQLFHPAHFLFVSFEISYGVILLTLIWLWGRRRMKRNSLTPIQTPPPDSRSGVDFFNV